MCARCCCAFLRDGKLLRVGTGSSSTNIIHMTSKLVAKTMAKKSKIRSIQGGCNGIFAKAFCVLSYIHMSPNSSRIHHVYRSVSSSGFSVLH